MDDFLIILIVGVVMLILGLAYFIISKNTHQTVKKELKELPESFKVISGLTLAGENNDSFKIDYIVIGNSGIYFLSIIDRKGIITGDESQEKWKEQTKRNIEEFSNPMYNNMKKMSAFRRIIGDSAGKIPISNIAIFHIKADINSLFSESLTIRANALGRYIDTTKDIISRAEINEIHKKLV
jgi:hypothetical protein